MKLINDKIRHDILIKIEKKWKSFLNDDQSASVSLYPMEKVVRAFVHEYAEYWKIQTVSYDPEPKRYVHCIKSRDTCAPYPLVSDIINTWPPSSTMPTTTTTVNALNQIQEYNSRELPDDMNHQRAPLVLKPRSTTSVPEPIATSSPGPTTGSTVKSTTAFVASWEDHNSNNDATITKIR